MLKLRRYLYAVVSFPVSLLSALPASLANSSSLKRAKRNTGIFFLLFTLVLVPSFLIFLGSRSAQLSQRAYASSYSTYGDLGQRVTNGVSSWLFGTNDTEEYDDDSILSDPNNIIIPSLANAHFGLVRSFFFHYTIYDDTNDHRTTIGTSPQNTSSFSLKEYSSPAPTSTQLPGNFYEVERRIDVIQRIGATCLGVLPSITTDPAHPSDGNAKHNYVDPVTGKVETDLQFDEEVVAYLGSRCNLYEFGNEPDNNGINEATYLQKWNEFVPKLKALNPNAKFVGGVLADPQGLSPCSYPPDQLEQCFMTELLEDIGSGKMNPVPDAISFHLYPCEDVDASTESQCMNPSNPYGAYSYSDAVDQVRAWMQQILGHTLPLGITEWNADPGSNPYMNNASFMTQYTAAAMQSMVNSKIDFAAEFDAQSGSGYTYLDMFDLNNNDKPKAQYTEMAQLISQYNGGQPPPPLPTQKPVAPGTTPGTGTGTIPTVGPGTPTIGPGTATALATTAATAAAGTPISTPDKLSISMAGDVTATPGQENGDNAPGQRPVLLRPFSPNNMLLDILFILAALIVGIGITAWVSLSRRRRRKKLLPQKVARKKTA